jgi:PAS domain S-box-containing protein
MFLSKKIVYGYVIALGITSLGTATGLLLGNYYHQEALQKLQFIYQESKSLDVLQLGILYNRPTKQLSPYLKDRYSFQRESAQLLQDIQNTLGVLETYNASGQLSTIKGIQSLLKEHEDFTRKFKQETQELIKELEPLTSSPQTLTEVELNLRKFFESKNFQRFVDFPDRLSLFTEIITQRERDADAVLLQAKALRIQISVTSLILSSVIAALFMKYTSRAIAIEQAIDNQKLHDQLIERQKVELALAASEAKSRAILSIIPELMFRVGRDLVYREFITEPKDFAMALQDVNLVGKSMLEMLPAEIAQRHIHYLKQALDSGELQFYEQKIQDGDRFYDEEVRVIKINEDEVLFMVRDISDRKRAELALANSEAHSKAMLSAIPDLMFRVGADGVYREFVTQNRDFAIATSAIDRAGLSMADVLPAAIVDRQFYYLQKALETGELQVYEQQVQVGDSLVDEEVRVVKSSDDEVLFMIRDISNRKQAEANLEKESRRSEMLFNTSLDGLLVLDIQGNVIEANQSLADMLGYSLEEITNLSIYDIDARWTTEEIRRGVQEFRHDKRVKFETDHRRKDGSLCTVEVSASSVDWADKIVQFSICRDITARKQTEQQLHQLNQDLEAKVKERTAELQKRELELQKLSERLALSLKSGAIGTWEWDIRQNKIIWDDRMYELYGVAKQSDTLAENAPSSVVVYDIWSSGIHPDDRLATETLLQQAALGQAEYDTEFRVVHPDHSIHFIKAYGIVIRDDQGHSQSMIGVNFDISDRKHAELQLQQTNEELIRATRLKDEFLANMSHELRTPLNAILGMTEGLQDQVYGNMNDRQIKALRTIERSSSHLLALINDILDLAKIEAGQIELECTSTSISHLCQSSLSFIKQHAMQKNIQLEIKMQINIPYMFIDERRIRQVLINLLNNAVKFTPSGGKVTLEVNQLTLDLATSSLPSSQYLRISVSDTGIGISPENIKRLFQPFIQIDSALNRQFEGTGLGLALVKRIVELHGGRVGLTSELGVGSCFIVDLPHVVACEIPVNNRTEFAPVMNSFIINEDNKQPPLVLLAEDNEANIITTSSYLEAMGYQILAARNGQEAIALAKAHQPDIILMDIQMPVMDGLEATRQIRLDLRLADIPIIAMTALAMAGDRDRCIAAGATEYLSKPVKLKELTAHIQKLLLLTK